jgi:hypothetical protein
MDMDPSTIGNPTSSASAKAQGPVTPVPDHPALPTSVSVPVEREPLPVPAPPEEVDLWWGSFASRTMLPSLLGCLLATAAIGWLTWLILPGHLVKLAFFGLAGTLWLVQAIRWSYRYFGFNYRLTTRRLFCHRGFLYSPGDQLDLAGVARVQVKANRWDRLVGVGRVLVFPVNPARAPLVLEGVGQPDQTANFISVQVQKAKGPVA